MSQITSPDGSTPSLKDQFEADKEFLLSSTEDYLSDNSDQPNITTLKYDEKTSRGQIAAQVAAGDFGNAIETLEILREQKTNIARVRIEGKDNTSVVIRDARSAKNPPVRDTEAFEMQYLNAIRAAIEVAKIELIDEKNPNPKSVQKFNKLKEVLDKKAQSYFDKFHENNTGNSQDEIFSKNNAELKDLILTLEVHGIKDARNKLNVAKEFQNFESSQANISTITKVTHKKNEYSVIESEVALRGLTKDQKNEYQKIKNNERPLPAWFSSMPKVEQQLTLKHIDAILSDKYVISTQLRQLVGMKNAFEKITAIKPQSGEFEVLHTSKHAGCLASFSHDESSKQGICNMNTRQAQEWIGNKKLHCNTFNSSTIGTKADRVIIDQTEKMLEQMPDVRLTNSAFNALRLSRLANNYDGSKKALEDIVSGLDKPELSNIKKYLDPKNSLSIYNDITNKHESIKREISKLKDNKVISEQEANILKYAADLKYSINKAERTFNLDINNINADISVHLNRLNNAVAKLTSKNSMVFSNFRQEEVLNMCASGKDRTGFAEHDQTVRAVAERISVINKAKVEAKDLDKQILVGGHTANQAGSISVGGNTIGCFGTKKDNIQSLPVHRMANLVGIIEVSASGNNLPKPTESEIDKAAAKKEKQDIQPNYMKPTELTKNKSKGKSEGVNLP